jgi:uncharacterized protein
MPHIPLMETSVEGPVEADDVTYPLDPRWVALGRRTAWVTTCVMALLLAGGALAAVMAAGLPVLPVAAVALLVLIAIAWLGQWWPAVEYRHMSYRLSPRSLEIRRGVLWRSVIEVPRSRIQHSDVSQGPFERSLGLGTLSVHTAGTAHWRVQLPGLAHPRALAIRDHLMHADEADVV